MQGCISDQSADADYMELEKLIPSDNLLRQINNAVDFRFVNELTEHCYSPNNGRASIPPELYFRMLLISYLFDIKSTRKLVQEVQFNIAYRWFCGLTLKDKLPHQASLSRVKQRLGVNIFEKFFIEILNQCKEAGILDGTSVMTDSSLFQANASLNSMVPLDEEIKEECNHLERGLTPPAQRKISNKTHISVTDPDATLAYKAGTIRSLKYKAHVCSDSKSRLILAIKITTGAVHDSQPYLELLNYINKNINITIKEVIADRAYGSGNIIATVNAQSIQTYIPLFSGNSGSSKHSVAPGFTYHKEKNVYICPEQHELKPGKASPRDYVIYYSSTKACQNCPLKTNCAAPKKKRRDIRTIGRHLHFDLFNQVKKEMETKLFKSKLNERLWKLEGIMNELKNIHGLSKAKYRGISNVQIQAYMTAIAINIKRLIFCILMRRIEIRLVIKKKHVLQQAGWFDGASKTKNMDPCNC
jgi:transposase